MAKEKGPDLGHEVQPRGAPLQKGQFKPIPASDYGPSGSHITYAHTVANIVNTAHDALHSGADLQPDVEWYDREHEHAKKIGKGNVEKGAGNLAALSPNTRYDVNRGMSYEVAKGKVGNPKQVEEMRRVSKISTQGMSDVEKEKHKADVVAPSRAHLKGNLVNRQSNANLVKAHDIQTGAVDPKKAFEGGSPKTGNFQRNIAHPEDSHSATIDFRAHDIAYGKDLPTATNRGLGSVGRYNYFADAYRDAGKQLNMHPHEVQALTWAHRARQKKDYGD